jgi:hypothetical protein
MVVCIISCYEVSGSLTEVLAVKTSNKLNKICREPEPRLVEVEIAIRKLKSYKSPGTDEIPAELIKAGGETLYSEIHRLVCCIRNKEELPQQWKESIIVPI